MFKKLIFALLFVATSFLYGQKVESVTAVKGVTTSGDTVYIAYTVDILNDLLITSDGDTIKLLPGKDLYILDIEVDNSRIFAIDSLGNLVAVGKISTEDSLHTDLGLKIRNLNLYYDRPNRIGTDNSFLADSLFANDYLKVGTGTQKIYVSFYLGEPYLYFYDSSGNYSYIRLNGGILTFNGSVYYQFDKWVNIDGNCAADTVTTNLIRHTGNIVYDGYWDGVTTWHDFTNSGTGDTGIKIDGSQINSSDLSDVAFIGMLDENEEVTGDWDFTDYPMADDEVADNITASNYVPLEDSAGHTLGHYASRSALLDSLEDVRSDMGYAVLSSDLTIDSSYSVVSMIYDTVGVEVFAGDFVFQAADGDWELADGDDATKLLCTGLVCAHAAINTPTYILQQGYIRLNSWAWTLSGALSDLLYISTTAGDATQTTPSSANDYIQILGYVKTADIIYFNPSLNWVKHE